MALILISLAVAAPRIAKSIQRDKELELIHRGEQYKRAIKLYYRKFGSYPSSIDQLMNTNNIRFLRKRYTDPMTGKEDWKMIHFGQAHVKTVGLFGQPISNGGADWTTAGSSGLGGMGIGIARQAGRGGIGPGAGDHFSKDGGDGPRGPGTDGSGLRADRRRMEARQGRAVLETPEPPGSGRDPAGIRIRRLAAGRLSAWPFPTPKLRSRNT